MHRLSNQTYVHFMETRPLLLTLISWGILVFVFVQLLMVLRMVYWCSPISITLQRSISYTLASFGRHCPPIFLIYAYVQVSIQTLSTYVGELMLPIRIHKTYPNTLHMVKMLGQATWIQNDFNSYLCERVVINYQKGGD